MTTIEVQYPVDHDAQMSTTDSRRVVSTQKIARLRLVFSEYGGGSILSPSSGAISAKRDKSRGSWDRNKNGAVTQEPVIVECYEREVPQYMAYVEPDFDLVKRVVETHLEAERDHVRGLMGGQTVPENYMEWSDQMRNHARQMPIIDNPAAKFSQVTKRSGFLPLLSCEVLEAGVDLPLTTASQARKQELEAMGARGGSLTPDALTSMLAANTQGTIAAVLAALDARTTPADAGGAAAKKIAEANKRIAELEAELAGKKKS